MISDSALSARELTQPKTDELFQSSSNFFCVSLYLVSRVMSTQEQFEAAAEAAKSFTTRPTNEELLKYAFFPVT